MTMVDHRPLILKVSLASETGVILPNFGFTPILSKVFASEKLNRSIVLFNLMRWNFSQICITSPFGHCLSNGQNIDIPIRVFSDEIKSL
jgi:hypothetical protein